MTRVKGQRTWVWLDTDRQQVRANIYDGLGGRHRPALCTFAEADLREDGTPRLNPETRAGARAARQRAALYKARFNEAEQAARARVTEKRRRSQSIRTLMQEWMDVAEADHAPGTLAYYRTFANDYIAIVGDHPVQAFTLRQADKLKSALSQRGLSNASINNRLKPLKTFLRWAHAREELDRVPDIPLLRQERRLPNVPSEDAVRALCQRLDHLIATTTHRRHRKAYEAHRRFLNFALGTGARLQEIFYLRWQQLDLDQAEARIVFQPRFDPKSRREEVKYLPAWLVTFLDAERRAHPEEVWYLDNGRGELAYKDPNSFSQAFSRHAAAVKMPPGVKAVHGFRALYATRLRAKGVDLETLRRLMGHTDGQVTSGYFAESSRLEREAVALLDRP